jgi:cytochrome c5
VSAHDEHSSFIKTPQQLIMVVLLSFLVPIIGIIMLVQLVTGRPGADPGAMTPEKIAERIKPVSGIEMGAPAAAPGARSGEAIVKATCAACHQSGVQKAPKIGDKNDWAPHFGHGLSALVQSAIKGKGAMPPRGGDATLTDAEVTRAVMFMANSAGANFKEPAAPGAAKKKSK